MIARLEYAAALTYSPRGQSADSIKSRTYRDALKRADPVFLAKAAAYVARQVQNGHFSGIFGPGATLVPVPGSAPRRDTSTLWVPEQLCQALRGAGLGNQVWSPLRRAIAVPKSAYAATGERPGVQVHIDSLRVDDHLPPTEDLPLVDDFVTKGRTLLAAATVLRAAFPNARVKAFALIRTIGLVPEPPQLVDPVLGAITWQEDAVTEP